jgi:hypothetical protein
MIDAAATMVIVGAALQAVPPGRAFIAVIRRRPNANGAQRWASVLVALPRTMRSSS